MQTEKLHQTVSTILKNRLSQKNVKAFLFGSSLRKEKFYDIDIGLTGSVDKTTLALLREDFDESNLPYKVDVVDFNSVSERFHKNVLNGKIVWLPF